MIENRKQHTEGLRRRPESKRGGVDLRDDGDLDDAVELVGEEVVRLLDVVQLSERNCRRRSEGKNQTDKLGLR